MSRPTNAANSQNPPSAESYIRPQDPEAAAVAAGVATAAVSLRNEVDAQKRCLPDIALRILESINSDRATGESLERELAGDPFVTAQILSVANSALFGAGSTVVSVRQAVVRVGLATVRDLVMLVVTQSTMFRIPGFDAQAEMLRRRSIATAVASRAVAKIIGKHTDYAFLSGLLHDVGHLLILERASKLGVLTPTVLRNPDLLRVALEQCAAYHNDVGAAVCEAWGLPQAVCHAAWHHHDFRVADHYCMPAHLMAVGDLIADHMGVGVKATPLEPNHPWCAELGLSPAYVQAAIEETEAQFPQVVSASRRR
jgi:HD-like signal output (HDOD) protein